VGGVNAPMGAWPWTVSIQNPWGAGTGHFCGGSLIHSQWVLTAGHCVDFYRRLPWFRVVVGANQLTLTGPEVQVRYTTRALLHQSYFNVTDYDIALLELDRPVECNQYVQVACVPHPADVVVSQLRDCYIAGWGHTTARTHGSDVLQEAKVRLIDARLCNSSQYNNGSIHSYNLCAGYAQGGIDACQGDSGGPLVCRAAGANFFWLVGVTSWGKGCGRAHRPGVYTSTQHFYYWILEQMRSAGRAAALTRAWRRTDRGTKPGVELESSQLRTLYLGNICPNCSTNTGTKPGVELESNQLRTLYLGNICPNCSTNTGTGPDTNRSTTSSGPGWVLPISPPEAQGFL
ncbi:acrosin-like, partial [Colius striatus]|uniref:acrosin-like n=1 Tax=Colius striatus TaxID=57412 RepID=UPI002B1DFB2A